MIKAAALFWLCLMLLTGAMLSGNYPVRAMDAVLSHILKAAIERNSWLPPPLGPAPTEAVAA